MYKHYLGNDSVAIFLFHGVVKKNNYRVRNYTRKHLPVEYFTAIVEELVDSGHAVSMDDLVEHYRGKKELPKRAFAVTFDDGFENNLTVAAPILVENNVPATFYVTTNFVESNGMSWIDRIESCFELTEKLECRLPWGGSRDISNVSGACSVLDEIRKRIKSDETINVDEVVEALASSLGVPAPVSGQTELDKKLSWQGVSDLAKLSGMTVGAHTQSHAILSFLDEARMREEITGSLNKLRVKAGLACAHFSYPEGQANCFNDAVIRTLRESGVTCCPTATHGVNDGSETLFTLKRITVV